MIAPSAINPDSTITTTGTDVTKKNEENEDAPKRSGRPSERKIDQMVVEHLEIERESALEAGTLGYMAHAMVQATMPHRHTNELRVERKNGDFKLTMVAMDKDIPLPYGALPRLMLAWFGAKVVQTGQRRIELGDTISEIMHELRMPRTGPSIARLKKQTQQLTNCAISSTFRGKLSERTGEMYNVGVADLWWLPGEGTRSRTDASSLELSQRMFDELIAHSVPVDLRVLTMFRRSPMQIDVYCWLVYRIFTLNRSRRDTVTIPWQSLQLQFGAGYPMTPQGLRDFKKNFLNAMVAIKAVGYPAANVSDSTKGLTLKKSPVHLPSRPPRKPHQ